MKPPASLIGEELINELLEVAATTPPGPFVEVGVYKGGSAWHMAKLAREQGRKLYLFDTFSGMPYAEPDDNHPVGDFGDADSSLVAEAIPDALIHIGVFPHTLPKGELTEVAFAHIDCDQYQSIRACIDTLGPLMLPGGVMWFDDYGCTRGADKAINESFDDVQITRAKRGFVRF